MGIVPKSRHSFKILFFIGSGLTAGVALARLFFAESKQFIEAKEANSETTGRVRVHLFIADARKILKEYWRRMIYAIILMAIFNYVIPPPPLHRVVGHGLTIADEVCFSPCRQS